MVDCIGMSVYLLSDWHHLTQKHACNFYPLNQYHKFDPNWRKPLRQQKGGTRRLRRPECLFAVYLASAGSRGLQPRHTLVFGRLPLFLCNWTWQFNLFAFQKMSPHGLALLKFRCEYIPVWSFLYKTFSRVRKRLDAQFTVIADLALMMNDMKKRELEAKELN